jgi:hypothetical protein
VENLLGKVIDITQPTDAEITAEQTRLQAEYDAKDWERI